MKLAPHSLAPTPSETTANCYHCGSACGHDSITDQDKTFCCSGCVTVYHLLEENGLSDFYRIGDRTSPKPDQPGKYAWLDAPEVEEALLEYKDDQLARASFRLSSMHCAACIWLLEHLYKIQPGVLRSEVDFPRKEIALQYNPSELSLRQVVELLDVLGYPPKLSFADTESPRENRKDRRHWYKLGIAGFCFGNIMLLSFPEYLGIQHSGLATVFNSLILLLSLPLLYSGRDYFRSAWAGLRIRQINMDLPIALGISVLFLRSTWDVATGMGHGYFDSLAGLIFFLLIGKIYQEKTYHLLSFDRDYRSYFPISITRLREGKEEECPVGQLSAGDVVLVRNGELIPADGELLRGQAELDYSFVTGESEPVPIAKGAKAYAGGRQCGEGIEIRLHKAVAQGYLPRLWNHEAFRKQKEARVADISTRIARWFTPAVLLLAIGAGVWWGVHDPSQVWNVVTSILIVACPCALALSTPFTLGHILRILGRKGMFLKGPAVVERMAALDHLVFDKTGTLTHTSKGGLNYQGDDLNPEEAQALKSLLRSSMHPFSRRIYTSLPDTPFREPDAFQEIKGKGLHARFGKMHLRLGSENWIHGKAGETIGQTAQQNTGTSTVALEINGELRGIYSLGQEVRPGIPQLLQDLKPQFQLSLVSGDHAQSRQVIAPYLPNEVHFRFQQKPADKLQYIQQRQEKGEKVAMVGDGLNDAGALQQSEVGIAVTDELAAFTPASDAILQAGAIPLLPQFLKLSRWGIRLIYASFLISLLYNLVGLWFAVQGELSPLIAAILMPASSLSVVLFTTGGVSSLAHFLFKPRKNTPQP